MDPATGEYQFVDTCFSTHHLQFAYDDRNTLWTSGGGDVVGWLDTTTFFETGDAEISQMWAPTVIDTNGNGQLDEWTEPGEPQDPNLDMRFNNGFYAVMPEPRGDSVWGSNAFRYPGSITRMNPGDNPPNTTLSEVYYPPLPGFGVRGADIDKNGVVWSSLGSGHLGEFDRRKWLYYTGETFDMFYPGFGDSWPSLVGAIGILTMMWIAVGPSTACLKASGTVPTMSKPIDSQRPTADVLEATTAFRDVPAGRCASTQ